MLALLATLALAQPTDDPATPTPDPTVIPTPEPEPGEPAPDPDRLKWKGYVLPVAGGNSTDGFGFGAGGEIFARPASMPYGYTIKISVLTWLTIPIDYTSQYLQVDWQGRENHLLMRSQYQTWKHLPYAGAGGADVSSSWGEDEDAGKLHGPYFVLGLSRPIRKSHEELRAYVQGYVHPVWFTASPGSLIEERQPLGFEGGTYGDLTLGVEHEDHDRFPLPITGGRAEIDVRGGGTLADGLHPLFGVHGEIIRWFPLAGERMVLGSRVVAEKSFGERPFFEQFTTGGFARDEVGFEQSLTGYGRIRSRGDGLFAAMVEARPKLFGVGNKIRLDVYLSAFAEAGWLFDGSDPGPFLPTVGFGPDLLFQKGSQLRPWIGWGWTSDAPGLERHPSVQFGLSTVDPL